MPTQTYTTDLLVLKKTKLKETDLILTCLSDTGAQLRLVARGARKPKSSFSSRLELFSCAHVLVAQTRGLGIVKEARLLCGNKKVRESLERSAAASVFCELLYKTTDEHLGVQHLYPMTCKFLECLGTCELQQVTGLTAAACLKAFSYLGFQPQLNNCVLCAAEVVAHCALYREVPTGQASGGESFALRSPAAGQACGEPADAAAAFSYTEGGVVCNECANKCNSVRVSRETLGQARFLLFSTFSEIVGGDTRTNASVNSNGSGGAGEGARAGQTNAETNNSEYNVETSSCRASTTEILQMCKFWTRAQLGVNLKSMEFLLSLSV